MKKSFYLFCLFLLSACSATNDISLQGQVYRLDRMRIGGGSNESWYINKQNPEEQFLVWGGYLPEGVDYIQSFIEEERKKRQNKSPICILEKKHYQGLDYYVCDCQEINRTATLIYVLEIQIKNNKSYGLAKIHFSPKTLNQEEQRNIAMAISQSRH